MKRLFAIVMVVLTVLSVGGVTLYSIHKSVADGGQPPEILFDKDQIDVAAKMDWCNDLFLDNLIVGNFFLYLY